MTKYRSGLTELPTYDVHVKEYDIKVEDFSEGKIIGITSTKREIVK